MSPWTTAAPVTGAKAAQNQSQCSSLNSSWPADLFPRPIVVARSEYVRPVLACKDEIGKIQ